MAGLEYSKPGGFEVWIGLECLEAWRLRLDGLLQVGDDDDDDG